MENTRRSFMAKLIAAVTVASTIKVQKEVQKEVPRKRIVMQPNTRIDVPAGYFHDRKVMASLKPIDKDGTYSNLMKFP